MNRGPSRDERSRGGYVGECMTESVTQGKTWEEFRAMVIDALDAHFFGAPKLQAMLLHLACNELFG